MLNRLTHRLGAALFTALPAVWDVIIGPASAACRPPAAAEDTGLNALVAAAAASLRFAALLARTASPAALPRLLDMLPTLTALLQHAAPRLRWAAAQTLAALASATLVPVMAHVLEHVLLLADDAGNAAHRRGAVEALYRTCSPRAPPCRWHAQPPRPALSSACPGLYPAALTPFAHPPLFTDLVVQLDARIVPYAIFLVVPLMARMTDADEAVRRMASLAFAELVKLLPLEADLPDPEGIDPALARQRVEERHFVEQLLDPSKAAPFQIPVPIAATLRPYQQDGVNWLAFLARYHLHGILCDGAIHRGAFEREGVQALTWWLAQQTWVWARRCKPSASSPVQPTRTHRKCGSSRPREWKVRRGAPRPRPYPPKPDSRAPAHTRPSQIPAPPPRPAQARFPRPPPLTALTCSFALARVSWLCVAPLSRRSNAPIGRGLPAHGHGALAARDQALRRRDAQAAAVHGHRR